LNDVSIAAFTVFLVFFTAAQIRFIIKIIKQRNTNLINIGVLFFEGIGACCCLASSGISFGSRPTDSESGDHLESFTGKPPDELELKQALSTEKKKVRIELTDEEKIQKIKEVLNQREKTSVLYVSNLTLIPAQKIISLLTNDPDYILVDEFIFRNVLIEKITPNENICSICKNPIKPGQKYCSSCGHIFN
jgi:hypothetical protein